MPPTNSPAPRRRREHGSAYVAALLVLLILTVMGLALATVTNLEMNIGTAERAVTRTFYNASTGINYALARALTKRDYDGILMSLYSEHRTLPGGDAESSRGARVDVSHLIPIGRSICNLCCMNIGDGGCNLYRVNHAVTSTGSELTWSGVQADFDADEARTRAQRTLTIMLEMQPIFDPPSASIDLTEEEKAKVKF